MKGQNQSLTSSCNIHPVEFIGVCPLCLNERLLVLASLQRLHPDPSPPASYQTIQEPKINLQNSSRKKPIFRLFSFFGFFELRHHKSHHKTTSILSPEDSFISIKFGATSWEKGKESSQLEHFKASWDHQYQHVMLHTKKKEIIPKPMPRPLLTWRKRISRLLHVISFKSQSRHLSSKVKGENDFRRSWLRPLSPTNKKTPN